MNNDAPTVARAAHNRLFLLDHVSGCTPVIVRIRARIRTLLTAGRIPTTPLPPHTPAAILRPRRPPAPGAPSMPRPRRHRHQTEADLVWYYSKHWEGEMGLSSGMGFQLSQLELGGWSPSSGRTDYAPNERQVEAASRFNDVRRRIQALTPRQRSILGSAFTVSTEDRLGSVALESKPVKQLHAELSKPPQLIVWVHKLLSRYQKGTAAVSECKAVDAARESLTLAVRAYEAA